MEEFEFDNKYLGRQEDNPNSELNVMRGFGW